MSIGRSALIVKCSHGPNAGKPGPCPEDRAGAGTPDQPSSHDSAQSPIDGARSKIDAIKAGDKSPEAVRGLAEHLGKMTAEQLAQLQSSSGLKAPPDVRDKLREKIAAALGAGNSKPNPSGVGRGSLASKVQS